MEQLVKFIKRIILSSISIYRKYISPCLAPRCRFYPSCSVFAQKAIKKYPLGKAFKMIVCRIFRCNPFCKGGYDPV